MQMANKGVKGARISNHWEKANQNHRGFPAIQIIMEHALIFKNEE